MIGLDSGINTLKAGSCLYEYYDIVLSNANGNYLQKLHAYKPLSFLGSFASFLLSANFFNMNFFEKILSVISNQQSAKQF